MMKDEIVLYHLTMVLVWVSTCEYLPNTSEGCGGEEGGAIPALYVCAKLGCLKGSTQLSGMAT